MKVLVADDDHDVVESTQMLLEMLGHECLCAKDPAAALEAAPEAALILLDASFADPDLMGLIKRLRDAAPDARVVLYTANAEADRLVEETGADGLLPKPFEAGELEAILAG